MKNLKKILPVLFLSTILFFAGCGGHNNDASTSRTIKRSQNLNDTLKTTLSEKIFSPSINSNIDSSQSNDSVTPNSILEIFSLSKVFWAIIFILIGFYIIKLISKLLDLFAEKTIRYRLMIKGLIPVVRIFGWSIVIYFLIAGIFKPPFATLIAVTASVGIAVGLAAQDILKNIFGGIMILFDRPFQVGDKIQIDEHYGEVIKIGLRSTKIVTPDDSTVTVPNGEVMSKSVSNTNYGKPTCQVVAEFYLPINIDTNIVKQIAIEAAQTSPYVYLNKPIVVLFSNEVNPMKSFLKMRLKAYVMDLRYEFIFKSDMTEKVLNELFNKKIITKENLV